MKQRLRKSWLCGRFRDRRSGAGYLPELDRRTPVPSTIGALFVVATILTGCGGSGGGSSGDGGTVVASATPSRVEAEIVVSASPSQAEAEIVVSAVRDLGPIEQDTAVGMRDCGYSALIDGRAVWVFGDTLLNTPNAHGSQVLCSSWATTFDLDAGDGIAGLADSVDAIGCPASFFPLTPEEMDYNVRHSGENCMEEPCGSRWAIWPGPLVVDSETESAYVFYHKARVEPGLLNIDEVGHSIAVWSGFHAPVERPVFGHYDDFPTLLFNHEVIGFGSAALLHGGHVYVYGCTYDERTSTVPCHLARVDKDHILDRSAWRFYTGGGNWSRKAEALENIFDGNDMMTVFFSPYLDRFLAVYSRPMDTRTMLRTARRPEGPWSDAIVLFQAEPPDSELGWVYDALAHPEYSQDGGRIIYVTYTRQTGPMRGEMRLVAVELERQF